MEWYSSKLRVVVKGPHARCSLSGSVTSCSACLRLQQNGTRHGPTQTVPPDPRSKRNDRVDEPIRGTVRLLIASSSSNKSDRSWDILYHNESHTRFGCFFANTRQPSMWVRYQYCNPRKSSTGFWVVIIATNGEPDEWFRHTHSNSHWHSETLASHGA